MSEARREFDLHRMRELERRAEMWERQYRLLLDSLPDAVFTEDEKGNLISTNAAGERLSGFPRQELLRIKIRELLPDLPGLPESGGHFTAAVELRARDGSRRPVTLHANIVHEPGWPVVVQYVARETAVGKRSEEAGQAETRFRLMTKNLTEMVLAYDMDRRLTFANSAAESLTGYSVADLEGREFVCWVHPEDRERMVGYWDDLFHGKSFFEEEYRLITKDRRAKWVAATWGPILDDNGRQVGVQGRERDVTERRMAEETLRQSEHSLRINEERYRSLFESSPFPMWEEDFSRVKLYLDTLKSTKGAGLREYLVKNREALRECVRRIRILDVNRAARDFYGVRDKEELLGDLNALFDEAAYETFVEEMATLAENGSTFKSELRTRTVQGEERNVSMIVSIVPTPNRDWSRVIVSFFDITDRKRHDEQLLQSQKL
jgi:PAS domain S-box-containing protein